MRQHVIAAGTFDPNLPRNRTLLALLERAGYEVVMCHVGLWGGDRHEIPNQRKLGALLRALAAYPRLVWRFLRAPRGDVVLVMYPGWFDMLVLSVIARVRRMPVVFDIFISLYDTVVSDRKLASPRSLLGRMCRLVDRRSIRSAQRVIADTPSHAEFFATLAGVAQERIGTVWVGAQDVFVPRPGTEPRPDLVLFYGTYIALHGIPTIIAAAKLLEDDRIAFRIVGTGQEQENVDQLMQELQPSNVERVDRVPLEQLPDEIAVATLCLGIFGTSDKARDAWYRTSCMSAWPSGGRSSPPTPRVSEAHSQKTKSRWYRRVIPKRLPRRSNVSSLTRPRVKQWHAPRTSAMCTSTAPGRSAACSPPRSAARWRHGSDDEVLGFGVGNDDRRR